MNSVTAPSRACTSRTNFATSAVRSVKPAPDVCTVSSEDTMVLAVTIEGAVREGDLGAGIKINLRRVGQRRVSDVPTSSCIDKAGGHASLCPPYKLNDCQILPLTSLCTRLAISIRRRQARSKNDIMRSM